MSKQNDSEVQALGPVITIRGVSSELHQWLKDRAKGSRRSMQQQILIMLEVAMIEAQVKEEMEK